MSDVRTDNDFIIGSNGAAIRPVLPMVITTRQQAYRAAAYIKLLGEVLDDEETATCYEDVETAIANT